MPVRLLLSLAAALSCACGGALPGASLGAAFSPIAAPRERFIQATSRGAFPSSPPGRRRRRRRLLASSDDDVAAAASDADGSPDAAERRRTVSASSSLDMPFPTSTAFGAFCDFPRQPSWSSWLTSVEYLEDDGGPATDRIPPSRWTARLFGLRYSWTSVVTEYVPSSRMGWRSITGMRTSGRVEFEEAGEGAGGCRVTLTMSVQAPRAVAALFKRSGALERYFRDRILGGTLAKFRRVVLEEDVWGGEQ